MDTALWTLAGGVVGAGLLVAYRRSLRRRRREEFAAALARFAVAAEDLRQALDAALRPAFERLARALGDFARAHAELLPADDADPDEVTP